MAAVPTELVTPALDDRVNVCRCEAVTAAAIRGAIDSGAISVNDVKRRTRAGMGLCQGIYCIPAISAMIADLAGVPIEQIVPMTARPPARVISLVSLAELSDQNE